MVLEKSSKSPLFQFSVFSFLFAAGVRRASGGGIHGGTGGALAMMASIFTLSDTKCAHVRNPRSFVSSSHIDRWMNAIPCSRVPGVANTCCMSPNQSSCDEVAERHRFTQLSKRLHDNPSSPVR